MNYFCYKKYHTIKLLVFVLGLFFIASCQNEVCNCPVNEVMRKSNDSSFVEVNKNWRKKKLWENYNEPYLDSSQHEAYRVSLYNGLENFTKIIRIEAEENSYQLTIKTYCDTYSLSTEKELMPYEIVTRPLSKKEWENITSKINENCFWTMGLIEKSRYGCNLGGNGILLMEGNNPKIECSNISPYHIFSSRSEIDSLTDYKYSQFRDMLLNLDKEEIK